MLRLSLHLGLRQKNPRRFLDFRSERDGGQKVLIPSNGFKNANASFFGKPFRLGLPNLQDLYPDLSAYIERHLALLLAGAEDPGTLFVKTVKTTSNDASCYQTTF